MDYFRNIVLLAAVVGLIAGLGMTRRATVHHGAAHPQG